MMRVHFHRRWLALGVGAALLGLGVASLRGQEPPQGPGGRTLRGALEKLKVVPPRVRELRTQQVGDTLYFQVRFEPPANLESGQNPPGGPTGDEWAMAPGGHPSELVRVPRLIPQDDLTHAVYQRLAMPAGPTRTPSARLPVEPDRPRPAASAPQPGLVGGPSPQPANPAPAEGLEFLGKVQQAGPAKLLLLYPVREHEHTLGRVLGNRQPASANAHRSHRWAEVAVTLDLSTAKKVAAPAAARNRKPNQPPASDDLEGLWAVAQAERFAVLEALAPDTSFYSFAREATGRKYSVPAPALPFGPVQRQVVADVIDRQLYETTTGAAAITESLQRRRMLTANPRDPGERKTDIAKVPGIDIAEHPWKEMIGDQKPQPEPLASFVPADNYYLHFKTFSALLEFADLADQWGTNIIHAYEVNSQDLRLRQRYEKQLCLKSTALGRLLGPAVIHSLAFTGSDLYLREGSDVTILFRARNKELLLNALNGFVSQARKEHSGRLQESKEDYHGVATESFVTPLREVSLHRAVVDNVVIYSNSPVGLRRVLDSRQGRHQALADALDFQYMRTVFRPEDAQEDGFLFLSDAFIRQLVGPASKIKEKRRLEALTSLTMVTNGVLFTAWETAHLPADKRGPLVPTGLKAEEIYAPGGKDVAWDARQGVALSDVYNTRTFATPLVELPIDRVTEEEAQGYARFRGEYLGLWRQYFDPIGMRLAIKGPQVRVETYILPLIRSTSYNVLRQEVGGGTTTLDPASLSPQTLVQLKTHINPRGRRNQMITALSILDHKISFDFLGDWFLVRLDDSAVYAKLAERLLKKEDEAFWDFDPRDNFDLLFQVPLTVGVEIRNPLVLGGLLGGARTAVLAALPGVIRWGPLEPAYKGVSIVRIQADPQKLDQELGGVLRGKSTKPFTPALYYAMIDGAFYLSLKEDCLKALVDASVARREGKAPTPKTDGVPINSSLYVAPAAAVQAGAALRQLLEHEVHQRALANNPVLYALFRAGLVKEKASEEVVRAAAVQYLGFVPISPDGAPYTYDARTDEVRNDRHGSLRRPQLHQNLAKASPLDQLLEQLRSLRADLRFREDGIQTVLTVERRTSGK